MKDRRPYKDETACKRIMNGTKSMPAKRIKEINEARTASLSAAEAQGRLRVQKENDSITLWS